MGFMIKDTFAKRLKAARMNRGITKSDLAVLCGVSRKTLFNWESGDRLPKNLYHTAELLSYILHVDLDYWFREESASS